MYKIEYNYLIGLFIAAKDYMKERIILKKTLSYIFFIVGIVNIIISIINFNNNKLPFGFVYLSIAITLIIIGFSYRNKSI
jgi:uncharacterized membrane protein HdeD (DUF308 family)